MLPQPGRADVVGVDRDSENTSGERKRWDHQPQPGWPGQQREKQADRDHDCEVPHYDAAAPAGVGQLMADPVSVFRTKPEPAGEQQSAAEAWIARQPGQGAPPWRPATFMIFLGSCRGQSLIWQMASPLETVCPTVTESPLTVPSLCAASGCSIFMASSTTMVSPADTRWPSSATSFTMVPCIGLTSVASPPPVGRLRRPRVGARGAPRVGTAPPSLAPPSLAPPAGPPAVVSRPGGSTTSSRFPPTSTVIRSRAAASASSPSASAWYG